MSIEMKTTFVIAAGPALVSGIHEGYAVKISAPCTVDLCGTEDTPDGIVESIDDAAGTCVVVRYGRVVVRYGHAEARIGATVTPGTATTRGVWLLPRVAAVAAVAAVLALAVWWAL